MKKMAEMPVNDRPREKMQAKIRPGAAGGSGTKGHDVRLLQFFREWGFVDNYNIRCPPIAWCRY